MLEIEIFGPNVIRKSIENRTNWESTKVMASITANHVHHEWYFQYKDEEGDIITGSTEIEWQSALFVNQHRSGVIEVHPVLNKSESFVDKESNCEVLLDNDFVYVLKDTKLTDNFNKVISNSGNCYDEKDPLKIIPNCCPPKIESCCSRDVRACCPSNVEDKQNEFADPPLKIVNDKLDQFKYTGEALRAVALPLGPLGGGSIAVAGDGGLRQWQINNKVSHNAQLPDSFFAIRVENEAVVLQSNTLYDQKGFQPAPLVTDHIIPASSIDLLSKCPGVKTIEITAKYPVVEVDYLDDKYLSNVAVHLETWSPKIANNSKASAVPAIVFDFHVTNKSTGDLNISLLASLQNMVGWDANEQILNEVNCSGYGGNTNSLFQNESIYGIDMSNTRLLPLDAFNGHTAVLALKDGADRMSTLLQYSKIEDLWKAFTSDTCLPGQGEPGISTPGSTFNGAVNTTRLVKAGTTTVFTYVLVWYLPNRYKDWSIGVTIPNTPIWVGNYYGKLWKNISEVISHVSSNIESYRKLTYIFRDSMFSSTLPWQLIDSAAGRVSVLNSPTCMWHADGYFYGFEGCSPNSGCCPLNCTHVWNFEMALATLYPDVEQTMREIDLLSQITPHGVIPSRTVCPLELQRLWNSWTDYSTDQSSCLICVDGEVGTIFKTYREYKYGATIEWLKKLWNPLKAVMNHWLNELDTDKNGLVYGAQPSTYDVALYGYNVAIGCLYLCGLRAMEEMGKIVGDIDFSNICHARFQLGTVNLDNKCFTNGKWYTQVVNPDHQTNLLTSATLIGSFYGQWWAHLLDLGYLLPKEHIQSHLLFAYQRNYVESFDSSVHQSPRKFCDARDSAWINGKWDEGEVPPHPLLYSYEVAWSGVIYPFAALLLIEGHVIEGLEVLEKTRQFYDGTRRSPWNEIECGDHYVRPMSGFSLFAVASGQKFARLADGSVELKFKPIIDGDNFSGFFTLGTGWGTYTQNKVEEKYTTKLKLHYGEAWISKFLVGIRATKILSQFCHPHRFEQNGDFVAIAFDNKFHLTVAEELVIQWQ